MHFIRPCFPVQIKYGFKSQSEGRGAGEMIRRCLCSSLVLFSGRAQSAQSLPAEADGNWAASTMCAAT